MIEVVKRNGNVVYISTTDDCGTNQGGLFAVECGAVESGCVYSPYSGELCEDVDEY